eukprot:gene6051-9149_t
MDTITVKQKTTWDCGLACLAMVLADCYSRSHSCSSSRFHDQYSPKACAVEQHSSKFKLRQCALEDVIVPQGTDAKMRGFERSESDVAEAKGARNINLWYENVGWWKEKIKQVVLAGSNTNDSPGPVNAEPLAHNSEELCIQVLSCTSICSPATSREEHLLKTEILDILESCKPNGKDCQEEANHYNGSQLLSVLIKSVEKEKSAIDGIWTVELLALLIMCFGIPCVMFTTVTSYHPSNYSEILFYQHEHNKDGHSDKTVAQLYDYHHDRIIDRSLCLAELRFLLGRELGVIVLVDANLLCCSQCNSIQPSECTNTAYHGHYIVLESIELESNIVTFRDPSRVRCSGACHVPAAIFDEARQAQGTDNDVLVVGLLPDQILECLDIFKATIN